MRDSARGWAIFAYFPSKEDILFCDTPEMHERLAQALRERPEGATTLDVVREFISTSLTPTPGDALRKRILASDDTLRINARARYAPSEELLVAAIGEDLDAGPDDIRPRIVAAALFAAFGAVHDPAAPPESFSPEHAMAVLDDVVAFLQGGLEALRNR